MVEVSDLLTVEEAAEALDMHPSSVRKAILEGRLPASRVGKRVLVIRREDVEGYKNAPKHAGGRPKKAKG